MTHEWKKRYEGAPEGQFVTQDGITSSHDGRIFKFAECYELDPRSGKSGFGTMEVKDGTKNLFLDAAINAKCVEDLEGENARLKAELSEERLENFGYRNELETRGYTITSLEWKLEALKAKFTPRPMSEAPRDGRTVFLCGHGLLREAHWMPEKERWHTNGWPEGTFDYWWCGWLPADTFKGGGDAT